MHAKTYIKNVLDTAFKVCHTRIIETAGDHKMTEFTKQELDAAIAHMRDIARDPAKGRAMQAAWNTVCDRLEPHYLAMRPKPKSFEVHHMNETARARFACAVVAGHSFADCTDAAVQKIT